MTSDGSPKSPKFDEEDKNMGKFSEFYCKYSQETNAHVNPLLHNKGSANISKGTPVLPNNPPSSEELPSAPDENETITEFNLIKPVASFESSEATPSGIAEFVQSEDSPVGAVFQMPIFEVHQSVKLLQERRERGTVAKGVPTAIVSQEQLPILADEKLKLPAPKAPYKSYSMQPIKDEGLEMADLSSRQYDFLKKVFAYKSNYLYHALNMQEIYVQYAAISKEISKITNSGDLKVRLDRLLLQQSEYPRNTELYKGNKISTAIININIFITQNHNPQINRQKDIGIRLGRNISTCLEYMHARIQFYLQLLR